MSLKLIIIGLCLIFIYNIYYNKNILAPLYKYKKYYKIILVILFGYGALSVINKNTAHDNYATIETLYNFINYMPVDKTSKDVISPFLSSIKEYDNYTSASVPTSTPGRNHIMDNHKSHSNKRSVSETKKKYVASQQGWKCKHCGEQLSAWFEVDHKVRLEYGGTNDVDNLEALCRECHGQKTAMENM